MHLQKLIDLIAETVNKKLVVKLAYRRVEISGNKEIHLRFLITKQEYDHRTDPQTTTAAANHKPLIYPLKFNCSAAKKQ